MKLGLNRMGGRSINKICLIVCLLFFGCERKTNDTKVIRDEIQNRFGIILSSGCLKDENGILYKNRSLRSVMYKASIQASCWKEIEASFARNNVKPFHVSFQDPGKQFSEPDDPPWWKLIDGEAVAYYYLPYEGHDGVFDELSISFTKEKAGWVEIYIRGTWDIRK